LSYKNALYIMDLSYKNALYYKNAHGFVL